MAAFPNLTQSCNWPAVLKNTPVSDMKNNHIQNYCRAALLLFLAVGTVHAQTTSGVQPESQVLLISETEGQAQMGVRNSDSSPLLLYTRVYEVEEDKAVRIVPVPPMTRVEPGARQIVRFVMEKMKDSEPLKVQHYKRVSFEGIPPQSSDPTVSQVKVNVRYDMPVIISPKGLPNEDAPWALMKWRLEGRKLIGLNPTPYVVRMSREVDLLPAIKRVEIVKRTYILPRETVSIELPEGVTPESVTGVRLFPATLYGYAAPDYDAKIQP